MSFKKEQKEHLISEESSQENRSFKGLHQDFF